MKENVIYLYPNVFKLVRFLCIFKYKYELFMRMKSDRKVLRNASFTSPFYLDPNACSDQPIYLKGNVHGKKYINKKHIQLLNKLF